MSDTILSHEAWLRFGCFLAVMLIVLGWERVSPRRLLTTPRRRRWFANLGLIVIDVSILRLLLPAAMVGASLFAAERGWGLFNEVAAPLWLTTVLVIVLLDLGVWAQHLAMHKIGPLWRLHRVHHTDTDIDVTTGVRFHPFEILLSTAYKAMLVIVLGAPAMAVIMFEIILNASALFTHGNVRLPLVVDRILRRIIVTPDMHRVHHSTVRAETDSNYGFNLALWDHLFGTYRPRPGAGHGGIAIGLPVFRSPVEQRLGALLRQPFLRS